MHQKTKPKPVRKPTAVQIDLISRESEPAARKDEWRLESPRDGPGTMPRDVYVIWRVLTMEGSMQAGAIEMWLLKHKGWDVLHTGRTLRRAAGTPQWFVVTAELDKDSKPTRRFAARQHQGENENGEDGSFQDRGISGRRRIQAPEVRQVRAPGAVTKEGV